MTPRPGSGVHSEAAVRSHSDQASALRALVQDHERGRPDEADEPRVLPSDGLCGAPSVAIASGKGGVGKSTISTSLCAALAQARVRVTLIDGDLGLGNADVLCGVTATRHLGHVVSGRATARDIAIEVIPGFRLVPGASGVSRLADLAEHERAVLRGALREIEGDTDLIAVDCGAGIGNGVLMFARAVDLLLVVTTPEPTAVTDAYALIKCVMRGERGKTGVSNPQVALVVNQARSLAQARDVHGRIARVVGRYLGEVLPLAGVVPHDQRVPAAVALRRPVILAQPTSRAGRAIRLLSAEVRGRVDVRDQRAARAGFVARILRSAPV